MQQGHGGATLQGSGSYFRHWEMPLHLCSHHPPSPDISQMFGQRHLTYLPVLCALPLPHPPQAEQIMLLPCSRTFCGSLMATYAALPSLTMEANTDRLLITCQALQMDHPHPPPPNPHKHHLTLVLFLHSLYRYGKKSSSTSKPKSGSAGSSDWHNTATIYVATPAPLAPFNALGPPPGGRPVGGAPPGKETHGTPSASIVRRQADP